MPAPTKGETAYSDNQTRKWERVLNMHLANGTSVKMDSVYFFVSQPELRGITLLPDIFLCDHFLPHFRVW